MKKQTALMLTGICFSIITNAQVAENPAETETCQVCTPDGSMAKLIGLVVRKMARICEPPCPGVRSNPGKIKYCLVHDQAISNNWYKL